MTSGDTPTLRPPAPPAPSAAAGPARGSPWLAAVGRNAWVLPALGLLYLLAVGFEYGAAPAWWPDALLPSRFPDNWRYLLHIVLLAGINITLAVSLQLINGVAGQFSLGHAGFMAIGAYLAGYATSTIGLIETDEQTLAYANAAAVVGYFVVLSFAMMMCAAAVLWLYWLDRLLRRRNPYLLALLIAVLAGWWVVTDVVFELFGPYDAAVRTWEQLSRWFVASIDAATAWLTPLSLAMPAWSRRPITFAAALLGGGVVAAIAGFVVGLPTLRLRGDYLAIATLGFAEIIRVVIVNSRVLGGATGMSVDIYWNEPIPEEGLPPHYMFPWVYGVALLTILTVWRIAHSPKGRAIAAVREDEIAAAAIGVDPTRHKVIAFMVGAFFAGVAGALYAGLDGYLNTNSFTFLRSIELVVMVTLGGLGSIRGAAIAAVLLTFLPEALRNAALLSDRVPQDINEWRMPIYALLLIVLMHLRSSGWYGRLREAWRRLRSRSNGNGPALDPLST